MDVAWPVLPSLESFHCFYLLFYPPLAEDYAFLPTALCHLFEHHLPLYLCVRPASL